MYTYLFGVHVNISVGLNVYKAAPFGGGGGKLSYVNL